MARRTLSGARHCFIRQNTHGVPSSDLWNSVSSKTMQPEMYWFKPAVSNSICR